MASVIVKGSRLEGKGIFAARDLKKGEVAFRFVGKTVDWQHCDHRSLQVGKNEFIRPAPGALPGWLNHSCEPNCSVRGRNAITALRAIKAGEEITIDYSFTDSMPNWDMRCLCGTKGCRKRLVGFYDLPKAFRERNNERWSDYLKDSA